MSSHINILEYNINELKFNLTKFKFNFYFNLTINFILLNDEYISIISIYRGIASYKCHINNERCTCLHVSHLYKYMGFQIAKNGTFNIFQFLQCSVILI